MPHPLWGQGALAGLVVGHRLFAEDVLVKPVVPQALGLPSHVTVEVLWFQPRTTSNVLQVKAGRPWRSQQLPTHTATLKLTQNDEPNELRFPVQLLPFGGVPTKMPCEASRLVQHAVVLVPMFTNGLFVPDLQSATPPR